MPEFQTSPGMRDILPPESARWRRFVTVFAEVVEAAGYGQVISPMLEDLGVFQRIGDATDVVTKEMYDFVDKGGRHIALRPELTASVCRAFVQHRPLTPWKVWYAGSQFRYEKPQRGRYRQFDQVGIEVLGADDPYLDVEVIALGWEFYRALGLTQVTLLLNSLGEPEDRARYVAALRAYFEANRSALSPESQITLDKNALRVLDSKRPPTRRSWPRAADRRVLQRGAPPPTSPPCRPVSTALGIPFTIDDRLVRGLDYYRHTTFEYQGGTLDSAQNALGGGGRYDGLVESLGGPATHGIGFALGPRPHAVGLRRRGCVRRRTVGARCLRRRHHRWARGAAAHGRAARRRSQRRSGVREPQHEGTDESRRPQRCAVRRHRRQQRGRRRCRHRASLAHRRRPADRSPGPP